MGQLNIESPTGVIDGVNTTFTLSKGYVPGSTAVFLNGLLLQKDLTDGWIETDPANGIIDFKEAPRASGACDDVIQVLYKDNSEDSPDSVIENICGTVEAEIGLVGYLVQEESNLTATLQDMTDIVGTLSPDETFITGTLETTTGLVGIIRLEDC